ncbi:MAG TPA: hypothetical protein VNE62_06565, partial [Actinomycetota bacterium]|nr:hypothetical protein [Actinomycetota bacterium]
MALALFGAVAVAGIGLRAPVATADLSTTPENEPPSDMSTVYEPGSLVADAKATFGARLAGVWIDNQVSPSVYRVGLVNVSVATDQATLDQLTNGNARVLIDPANHSTSLSQLEAYKTTATRIMREEAEPEPWMIFPNDKTSRLKITHRVPLKILTRSRLDAAIPGSVLQYDLDSTFAVVLISGHGAARVPPTTRLNYPPHYAGLNMGSATPQGVPTSCTSGYTLVDPEN